MDITCRQRNCYIYNMTLTIPIPLIAGMMKRQYTPYGLLPALAGLLLVSCHGDPSTLSATEGNRVKDSVSRMTANIASDISAKGPVAWLNYFEEEPGFFMASDGQLAFPDHPTAKSFIENTLVKTIRQIKLRWTDLRVDPLTSRLASIGAGFHEDVTDSAGRTLAFDGYFTGIAEERGNGWQLRNAHWSILKAK
jgi:hypothetical protein